jgi:DNA ligase-1
MVPAGILGGFEVKDLKTGVSFKVGNGFELKERVDLWAAPTIGLLGKIIKYSYFPTGSKEKPRFPVFRGFRDKRDMS